MTDSLPLEEVFGRVIAEHQTYGMGPFLCSCGWQAPRATPRPSIVEHQAERLAARFKQVGWCWPEDGPSRSGGGCNATGNARGGVRRE